MGARTRKVPRGQAKHYLAKAEEFAGAASAECVVGRYSACGLTAVHAGISACDAVTSHIRGEISTAQNHAEAVGLLRTCFNGRMPSKHEQQILGLLALKNDIEYSGHALSPERAKTLVDQATRFTRWASSIVRQPPTPPGSSVR